VQSDPVNCGDCAKKCASGEACSAGKCTLLCRSGLTVCPRTIADGGAPDGAVEGGGGMTSPSECADLQADSDNCGKCGTRCPADKPFCDFGQCKLYKFTGILTNVNQDDLSPRWTECHTETYQTSGTSIPSTVLTKCPQANLMLACRQTGMKTLVVAAMAPRADVIFDVGSATYAHRIANGVAWYYSVSTSWGFFVPLDGVTRFNCDVSDGIAPEKRLCWHTSGATLTSGYRCGTHKGLSAGWDRVIFQTP
jgi:hypothetical protein